MRMVPLMRVLTLTALAMATVALLPRPGSAANEKVGINAAVNTNADGTPPGGTARRLVIGEDVVHNERITTDPKGQTQILFVDGSSISIGPSADLLIDDGVDSLAIHARMRAATGILPRDIPPDSLTKPGSIAEAYWFAHQQARDGWTHELDLRPFVEAW